ncbi:MAG TPA: DUF2845 domain-containing protein [Gammaproteobacteria bacterium]|nr:DUF2845 domain-containing protein [Gammaproteobacteria bacterium]
MRAAIVFFAVLGVAFSASGEDTIRCRNGRLVNVGMTAAEVTSRCGEPTSRTVEEIPVMTRLPTGAVRQTGTTHAERWIYARGQGQFDAMLTFEDGKLRRIDLVTEP